MFWEIKALDPYLLRETDQCYVNFEINVISLDSVSFIFNV